MVQGTIIRFDDIKGYGFINPDGGGDDVFVHLNEFDGRNAPVACGTRVEFGVLESGRGQKAYNVRVIDAAQAGTHGAEGGGGSLPRSALADSSFPAATGGKAEVEDTPEVLSDRMCEVFSESEFLALATEMLLASAPDMPARHVVDVRRAMVRFASDHGWIE